jgi:hypothetical protein
MHVYIFLNVCIEKKNNENLLPSGDIYNGNDISGIDFMREFLELG